MPDLPPPQPVAPLAARLRALADDAGLRGRHLAAGAAVAVVVTVAAVVLLGAGRSSARPEVVLPQASHTSSTFADDGGGAGGASETSTTADGSAVVVDAAGAVARPGLYRVAGGGRVADLISAAGGPAPDADLDQLNLAAKLNDGDRVYVPRKGEVPPAVVGPSGSAAAGASAAPVDLNSATLEQLDALPGVGPTTAQAILDYRRTHGRFHSVQELLQVHGIGPAKLAQLQPKVRV